MSGIAFLCFGVGDGGEREERKRRIGRLMGRKEAIYPRLGIWSGKAPRGGGCGLRKLLKWVHGTHLQVVWDARSVHGADTLAARYRKYEPCRRVSARCWGG